MCPDRQIISLYYDGELPSPWKEKMEDHLKDCSACSAALASYGSLLKQDEGGEESMLAARERVWKKLTAPSLVTSKKSEGDFVRQTKYTRQSFWNRSIPLPAAAAAAVFIIVAMIAIFGLRDRNSPKEMMAAIPDFMPIVGQDQGIVPMNDMSRVLQYLSSMDNGDFMVIRLPESRNFIHAGEPALINAADYSRRQLSR